MNLALESLSYKKLFDSIAEAMLLVDSTGTIIQANPAALTLLAYTEATIVGLKVEALIPEGSSNHHPSYRDSFFKNPSKRAMNYGRNLFALSANGNKIAVDIGLSPIKINDALYVLASLYPSDKRQMTENALLASEERFRLARQAAGLGIYDCDLTNGTVHWDERIQELWGGKPEDLSTYQHYKSAIHPEDKALVEATIKHASDPASNGAYKVEFRIISHDNGIERWGSTSGQVHFKDKQATRLLGVVQDITEHKLFEKNFL